MDGGGGELGCEGDIFFYLNTVLALGVWGRGGGELHCDRGYYKPNIYFNTVLAQLTNWPHSHHSRERKS